MKKGRGIKPDNESKLKTYLSEARFKNGKKRKHKRGAQRILEGYQKYNITVLKDDVADMKHIALTSGVTIKQVFTEAIQAYIARHR